MRGPRLPAVFSARGRTPLPRDLHRVRPGLRLMILGVVVTTLAGLGLASAGYGAAAVWLLVAGPREDVVAFAAASLGCGLGAAIGPRIRTALVRRWIAAEDARRLGP